ncbi:glutamyl-tRNA reductase [Nibricoccus sp. IMCC34717]|uniref:glutamyl-tRNA reductase n=1 Tax=Nibricoccus sp. IMCC34717 TaxID=3034021 RepID=UPI00384DF9C6
MSQPTGPVLFYFGASHHQCPIELREKLAVTDARRSTVLASLTEGGLLREFTLLNTCNRVEFYAVGDEAAARLAAERFFATQGFSPEQARTVLREASGPGALVHLISVACGLDSQMLGETEILGQVKDAYARAVAENSVGPVLNRVFQKTFQHAKYVRSNTAITEGQISVANVAVDLASKIFGSLEEVRVLLLGAGDIGEKTAKAFQSRGSAPATVASRTFGRAMELASQYGGAALPWEHFEAHLGAFDIVVCSTAAPHAVVSEAAVQQAMQRRRSQPLFFIDLALPRDVAPEVATVENVFVYNLDDLARIAEENLAAREAELSRANQLVAERARALWDQVKGALGANQA